MMARAFGQVLQDKDFVVSTLAAMKMGVTTLFLAFNDDDDNRPIPSEAGLEKEAPIGRVKFLRPLFSLLFERAADKIRCFEALVSYLSANNQLEIIWAFLDRSIAKVFLTSDRTASIVE